MLISVPHSLRSKFPPFKQHNRWYHRSMVHMSRRVVSHYQVTIVLNVSVHIRCECVTVKQVIYKVRETNLAIWS